MMEEHLRGIHGMISASLATQNPTHAEVERRKGDPLRIEFAERTPQRRSNLDLYRIEGHLSPMDDANLVAYQEECGNDHEISGDLRETGLPTLGDEISAITELSHY